MILGRRRSIAGAAIAVACTLLTAAAFGVVVPSAGAAGAPYKVNSWTDPAGDLHRVRWDPCQTVTYAVNVQLAARTNRARARAVGDVQRAFRRAARETGLHFSYSGRTREVPRNTSQSWSARQQAAEIVVAWVNPARPKFRSDLLSNDGSGYPSGVGGWMLRGWLGPNGHWQAAVGRGFVVINAQQNHVYKAGYGAGVTRGALLLHELGHALGLSHVGETRELMYPTMLDRRHSNYKSGDERGLNKVGRKLGCIPGTTSMWPQI